MTGNRGLGRYQRAAVPFSFVLGSILATLVKVDSRILILLVKYKTISISVGKNSYERKCLCLNVTIFSR